MCDDGSKYLCDPIVQHTLIFYLLFYLYKTNRFSFLFFLIKKKQNFKPAFEVDQSKFAFKPRVQRINELEALTRSKLCFFEKVIKYWNLQGVSLRIPVIEQKIIDLLKLHRTVFDEGGFEQCVREKKWMKIATTLYRKLGDANH